MLNTVQKVIDAVSAVTGEAPHSAWLYGSAVWQDLQPGWSDIDLLILTASPLTEEQAQRLLKLRQELAEKEPENPHFRTCEGIIACADEYRSGDFSRLVYWGTTGERITDRCPQDTFTAFQLARYARCIAGTEDRSLFAEPDRAEMTAAVQTHYEAIRKFAGQTDESLYSCGWLLDIARCIYTLRYNDIVSKTWASLWAKELHVFPDEEPLLKTLEIRRHPLQYKDREDVKQWLKDLGPTVQQYADVLEQELQKAAAPEEEPRRAAEAQLT
ncbi:MAG: nucleotidyltransferase domain-containing protein [Lachnospiraceae bacterium]|nr:nucleotidyltransferase domain-containing protein [Lachnospiraceae bacterium]